MAATKQFTTHRNDISIPSPAFRYVPQTGVQFTRDETAQHVTFLPQQAFSSDESHLIVLGDCPAPLPFG
jgi:hypothetical protein